MWFKKYREERSLEKRIRQFTEAERRDILAKSPFELGLFQGTGYDVFLKNEPDFEKAYVYGLGEVSTQEAEDWIIRQYLLAEAEKS